MQTATLDALRHQLEDRRTRLRDAIATTNGERAFVDLLRQVDTALANMRTEDYALCLVCLEHVDERDLVTNPLLQYCLCDLTPEQQRSLEHDLGMARRIQTSLLPDPDVRTDGWRTFYRYEPAGVVGGDYCDLWKRPQEDGTVYFAVGDVSGKGVAASLLMAHLQAAFRSLAAAELPLSELVTRINRQLLQVNIPSHYATLVCGRAGRDGRVELVNAGHCPPLVAGAGGVRSIGSTGFPVGLFADRPYEVSSVSLGDGDTLVLYTDGLTEARGPDGSEYGQARVEELLARRAGALAPRELVQSVRTDLDEFLAGSPRADDLTLLALQRANGTHR
jgi:sigma-B regulation protein RsbU (phosphoserine phosphatase)